MKKILAICFSPDKGGLELYLVKMIDHFNKKFSNVYGLFCPDSYIAKNIQSPHLILKKPSFLTFISRIWTTLDYIHKNNIEIIHVSWTKDLFFSVLLKILSRNKIKIIYYRQMKLTRYKNDFYHRFIYKNIDKILVITKNLERECEKLLPVDNNSISCLHYGINGSLHKKDFSRYEFLHSINLNPSLFTIGVFSRVEEQKGQHLVIEALKLINTREIQLVIVGHVMNDNYIASLKKLISEYGLEDKIRFVPFVEKPMEIMQCLNLTILSTYEETFGLVVAESMLVGTPVIGSNAGGVTEIIQDGMNGLLFETKNIQSLSEKIMIMIESRDLRDKFIKNGISFVKEKFDYDRHFSNLQDFIRAL